MWAPGMKADGLAGPSGFDHDLGLVVGRRHPREFAELLGGAKIGLLPCETARSQRGSDRGISLLPRRLTRRAARRPASPTETHDHGKNATDQSAPDSWFERRAKPLHKAPPGAEKNVWVKCNEALPGFDSGPKSTTI